MSASWEWVAPKQILVTATQENTKHTTDFTSLPNVVVHRMYIMFNNVRDPGCDEYQSQRSVVRGSVSGSDVSHRSMRSMSVYREQRGVGNLAVLDHSPVGTQLQVLSGGTERLLEEDLLRNRLRMVRMVQQGQEEGMSHIGSSLTAFLPSFRHEESMFPQVDVRSSSILLREEEILRNSLLLQVLDRRGIPSGGTGCHTGALSQSLSMQPAVENTVPNHHLSPISSGLFSYKRRIATESPPTLPPPPVSQQKHPVEDVSPWACFRRGESVPLVQPTDKAILTEYQLVVRESLVLFELKQSHVILLGNHVRNRLQVGQVGLRCRYCEHCPSHRRGGGAVYFPGSISSVYQTAQNIANVHLVKTCTEIPPHVRKRLVEAKQALKQKPRRSGGSSYWLETMSHLGLEDRVNQKGVWARKDHPPPKSYKK